MPPTVSVLVANFNGQAFVRDALLSAARQSLKDIEIIFVDDGSTDRSVTLAEEFARRDPRVRIIPLTRNTGPGAARNAGLAAAQGRWIAILDSDDQMHPDRLSTLVAEAEGSQADLCADDLLVFKEDAPATTLLAMSGPFPRWITTSEFLLSNQLLSRAPSLGYLKPIIRADALRRSGVLYDTSLKIGEDYDLVIRLLLRGARYRVSNFVGYFYRKHRYSTSHRISADDLQRLIQADDGLHASFSAAGADVQQARELRRRSIDRALAYAHLVSALKQRSWLQAARISLARPSALLPLAEPLAGRLRKLVPNVDRPGSANLEKSVCVLTRQRITGSTAGNSSYLLSLCKAIRARGYRITLISPNPATFGRWPFLYLDREMDVFDAIFMRGAWRLGRRLFLARDPRVLFRAGLTVAERMLMRAGLLRRSRVKPAPYAIAVPWTREDQLFIATHAPKSSSAVIADYAFLTPGIPFALCPSARSLVVMHDLFCSRASQFEGLGASDSVATLDEASELALLDRADAVAAIQASEARFVSERLPGKRVFLAPMAVTPVDRPQPGNNRKILFVGTNTAPNVLGMQWFLGEVWPRLRAALPDCTLQVAGSVCDRMRDVPDGVELLGFVRVLEPLYSDTGVVISPLRAGSGLKIKLIEALSHGKAIVATPITIDGVAHMVESAVCVADAPDAFADAIARLLRDDKLRQKQAHLALETATRWFSADRCYAEVTGFVSPGPIDSAPAAKFEQDAQAGHPSSTSEG